MENEALRAVGPGTGGLVKRFEASGYNMFGAPFIVSFIVWSTFCFLWMFFISNIFDYNYPEYSMVRWRHCSVKCQLVNIDCGSCLKIQNEKVCTFSLS